MSFSSSILAGVHPGAGPGPIHRIGVALTRAWLAYLERRLYLQMSSGLYAMSDRELKDIGLSRAEIDAAIRYPELTPHHQRGRYYY